MTGIPITLTPCTHECGAICGQMVSGCAVFSTLPVEIQEMCQKHPHLLQYYHAIPLEKIGIPQVFEKINRGMKSIKNRNLIYKVSDDIFIHILANYEDIRDYYIPIEPCTIGNPAGLIDKVEVRLADYVEELENAKEDKARLELIMKIMDKFVAVDKKVRSKKAAGASAAEAGAAEPVEGQIKEPVAVGAVVEQRKGGLDLKTRLSNNNGANKISMNDVEYDALKYIVKRKMEGMGVLDPLIQDTNIEDISCSGVGDIFVEHKVFGSLRTAITFETTDELDKFVIELADGIKHPVTFRNPCVDATLADGSRINIVYGTDVSKRGSNFTIRKFSGVPMSILELVQFGTLSYEMAGYLSVMLQEGMNIFVSGETASGKTTLMNALTTFIVPEAKIVSIEDTPELQVPHPNWIRGVTRESGKSAEASGVSMFDLLKAALRQRPNIIIVGEIRGEEGAIAFQAMQTGHACMSTFHASTVTKLIQRLTGNPINVPKSYVDNLNIVIIAQQVRLPNGSNGRRITSISEIVGYDSVSDSFSFIETFRWNPLNDTFDFKGDNNSYLLEEKIASRRGISYEKRNQIYLQVRQRAEVLKKMQEQNMNNFYDLYAILSKAYREGYFR